MTESAISPPDVAIEQRLLAPAIGSRLGDRDQLIDLAGQNRKSEPSHTGNLERRHQNLAHRADAEVARTFNGPEDFRQLGAD
jgi:hypothetical protein